MLADISVNGSSPLFFFLSFRGGNLTVPAFSVKKETAAGVTFKYWVISLLLLLFSSSPCDLK